MRSTHREASLLLIMAQIFHHKKNVDSVAVFATAVELLERSLDACGPHPQTHIPQVVHFPKTITVQQFG
jgi:hypothetical protein